MVSTVTEFRSELKAGKRYLKSGQLFRAELHLQRARDLASYIPDERREALVSHRLAEVAIFRNEPMLARGRYKRALQLVDKNDTVAYAILLRDYGEFERRQGHWKIARRSINQAMELIQTVKPKTRRVQLEVLATKGFVARLGLSGTPQKRAEGIVVMKQVDNEIRGTHKHQYELANLAILIEVIPFWDLDRFSYIRRAVVLSFQLGNVRRAAEFTAMLGGKTSRAAFRTVVK